MAKQVFAVSNQAWHLQYIGNTDCAENMCLVYPCNNMEPALQYKKIYFTLGHY